MATGRTLSKWAQCWIDGYNMTGITRSFGPLGWTFDTPDLTANWGDAVKGTLPDLCTLSLGTYNTVWDATTDNTKTDYFLTPGLRHVMIPVGIQAAAAMGDWAYVGDFLQASFMTDTAGGAVTASMAFDGEYASRCTYTQPWGKVLAINETFANTTDLAGFADGSAVTTALGGYFMYQIHAGGSGTWTIKIQSATTAGGSYSDVGGLSVTVDGSVIAAGIVETTSHATSIDGYIRYDIHEDVAGTLVASLVFVRGR